MAAPLLDKLLNPLLTAMHELGGSGSLSEIEEKVAEVMKLSEADLSEIHRGNVTKFNYQLAWARTYLKNYGLLENSARGVWALSDKGRDCKRVDPEEVMKFVLKREGPQPSGKRQQQSDDVSWQENLLDTLLKLPPSTFEKLCQRLLRESGFVKVEVTGRTGDGGIDGKGIMRMGGMLSFHLIFQCKRYSGSVPCGAIRDFRGAMVGRADKGLFITTGSFTRDAVKEATRDGAPHIDLVDGEQLAEKMKELKLGMTVSVKSEETVEIDKEWFRGL
mgnify:CR=1 FL=1